MVLRSLHETRGGRQGLVPRGAVPGSANRSILSFLVLMSAALPLNHGAATGALDSLITPRILRRLWELRKVKILRYI